MADSHRWLRRARRAFSRIQQLRPLQVPDGPAQPVRDPWPGDAAEGARLVKGELNIAGTIRPLQPGGWNRLSEEMMPRAAAHGFTWLRDLRALGTDAARARARLLVSDWIGTQHADAVAERPDVVGGRITAWLGHYDFFAASADDVFRRKLMSRIAADAMTLAAALPAEELDARALTALKGLIVAAVALPDRPGLLTRAQRFLPQEIARQILPDGCHVERSPAVQLGALQDLIEIRSLLQTINAVQPAPIASAIERMVLALRTVRHGDGGLALFNGSREGRSELTDLVLTQAGRSGRPPAALPDGGFYRLAAGRTVLVVDAGAPAGRGLDRFAHAGTLSFELSIGRERLLVNCGAAPAASAAWRDAMRATAAHSTLVIADVNSSELAPEGLGRRPEKVAVERQEASGAHWLETSHDGWLKPFGAIHHRRLYVAESGEDVRGEDAIEAETPQAFTIRFHLHPAVVATLQQDGEAALLRLPSGGGWRLRAEGAKMTLEESVYLGTDEAKRAEQVVLSGYPDGPQQVKWAVSKVG
ncbi:MAG: heparinase II/III family protein [Acetobacteraceae bacterium]